MGVNSARIRNAVQAGADDYQIAFALKPTGADKFGRWTGANIMNIGVVLNDEVKSIAYIKSQIHDQGKYRKVH